MTADLAPLDFASLSIKPGYRLAVIGSHGGIGEALCRAALSIGAEVAGFDTPGAIAQNPAALSITIPIDVTDEAAVADAFATLQKQWGRIDGLAFVSGIGIRPTSAIDHDLREWDRTFSVNLRGALVTCNAAHPLLADGGAMVLVSSGLATDVHPGFAAYGASKAGMLALMKTYAREWAPAIRVNCIAPGVVKTAFLGGGTAQKDAVAPSMQHWFGSEERAQSMREAVPLKRVGTPDDIVAPMLFLLGDAARFITGQTLYVNGGRYTP